jgi:hypothetical protein
VTAFTEVYRRVPVCGCKPSTYQARPHRQGEHNAQNQGYGSMNAQFHILQLPPHLGSDADGEDQQATQDDDNKGRLHAETNSVGNFVYTYWSFSTGKKEQVAPLAGRKRPGNGHQDKS